MSDGMPQESVTLTLKKPLTIGDRVISEITIREPTAGEMAMAEQTSKKGDIDQGIILLGLSTGLHPNVVKQLLGSDYVKAQKVLGNFFLDGQETGESA
jgi:hypothetical protein